MESKAGVFSWLKWLYVATSVFSLSWRCTGCIFDHHGSSGLFSDPRMENFVRKPMESTKTQSNNHDNNQKKIELIMESWNQRIICFYLKLEISTTTSTTNGCLDPKFQEDVPRVHKVEPPLLHPVPLGCGFCWGGIATSSPKKSRPDGFILLKWTNSPITWICLLGDVLRTVPWWINNFSAPFGRISLSFVPSIWSKKSN